MGVTALSLGQTTLWFDDRAEACWTNAVVRRVSP